MITVTELTDLCTACPTQWEGKTDDGRFVYVRFRWGGLTVCIGDTPNDAVLGDCVFAAEIGGPYDGVLSFDELVSATEGVVTWPS